DGKGCGYQMLNSSDQSNRISRECTQMNCGPRIFGAVVLAAMLGAVPAKAEKPGGVLKSYSIDSPASMSIHEEATVFALRPAMGVFSNLVIYDQHVKQNSMQSIVPELAKSW